MQTEVQSSYQMHGHHRPGGNGQDWNANALSVAKILQKGGKALVVGGHGEMFSQTMRDHPQLIFWSNIESDLDRREVPANVRVIVLTRWVRHHLTDKLIKTARTRRLHVFPMLGPGQVKQLLAEVVQSDLPTEALMETPPAETADADVSTLPDPSAISLPDPTPEAPDSADADRLHSAEEAPTMAKAKANKERGWLKSFIEENVNLKPGMTFADEARRLFALAQKKGLKTTMGSMNQGVRVYGAGKGRPDVKALAKPPAAASKKKDAATRAAVPPTGAVLPSDERLVSDIAEARRMVTEMVDNVKASSDVITEMLDRLQAEIFKRRERSERLKELLSEG
jgi:hypothetical protein